jgi:hypothetical protein
VGAQVAHPLLDYAAADFGRKPMTVTAYLDRFVAGVLGVCVSPLLLLTGALMLFADGATGDRWRVISIGLLMLAAGAVGLVLSVRQCSRHVRNGLFWPPGERGAPPEDHDWVDQA